MKQDSWLYSDSFLKRAFAVWGYNAVASLIISIPFTILWAAVMAAVVMPIMRQGFTPPSPAMQQQGLPAHY